MIQLFLFATIYYRKTFPVKWFYIGSNKAHFLSSSAVLEIQNGGNTALLIKLCFMAYRMSQFVGGNLCWRFLRKFTFGGFYFGDFLHLQELGVARVNGCAALLADFILAIYLSTANPPTLIPRQQIDSYGIMNGQCL